MKIGKSAGKSFAYILGVYLGDGCVTRQLSKGKYEYKVFRLNTIDEDFALATKAALQDLSQRNVSICKHGVKKSTKPNWSLALSNDKLLCDALVEHTKAKTQIPGYVFTWPRDLQIEFVAGLMDSEGYVSEVKRPHNKVEQTGRGYMMGFKCCDTWFFEFVRLVESLGIRLGKIYEEKPYRLGYKIPRGFRVKMQSWLDAGCYFKIKRKQDRVQLWGRSVPYSERTRCPRRLAPETARQTAIDAGDTVRTA